MATYKLISSITVGSGGASTIDFTSIPATYTDLLIKVSARNTNTDNEFSLKFNGNSSSYSSKVIYGTGSSTGAYNGGSTAMDGNPSLPSSYTANTFSNNEIYITNYISSNYKSVLMSGTQSNNSTTTLTQYGAGLWSNTSAINQVTLSAAFVQYSTASLYGIKNS